jgi:hypothetical protein
MFCVAFGYLSHDLTAELSRLYEQDQRINEMLHRAGFDLPPELRIIRVHPGQTL